MTKKLFASRSASRSKASSTLAQGCFHRTSCFPRPRRRFDNGFVQGLLPTYELLPAFGVQSISRICLSSSQVVSCEHVYCFPLSLQAPISGLTLSLHTFSSNSGRPWYAIKFVSDPILWLHGKFFYS